MRKNHTNQIQFNMLIPQNSCTMSMISKKKKNTNIRYLLYAQMITTAIKLINLIYHHTFTDSQLNISEVHEGVTEH